jgi:hypothetical protein
MGKQRVSFTAVNAGGTRCALLLVLTAACAAADEDAGQAGDPAAAELDILARLRTLPGISNIRELPDPGDSTGSRSFELEIAQAIDHFHPELGTFQMRVGLAHSSFSAPTTIWSTGYWFPGAGHGLRWETPGNGITFEHRFFGPSTPGFDSVQSVQPDSEPPDAYWQYLTARQAAADQHRVVETFKALYPGPWLSFGHSKGGVATLFHRQFYPDDVAGSVVLGAPAARGTADPRFAELLEQLGDAECRAGIIALQRAALTRRSELREEFDRAAAERELSFDLLGSEVAFEHFVEDYRFKFWQTAPYPQGECPRPDAVATMSAEAIFTKLDTFSFISFASDQRLRGRDNYEAYYYQAATELGDHGPLEQHLEDLIEHPGSYGAAAYSPIPSAPFDPSVMLELERWVLDESERIIFVYGANDPWRAGAFATPNARDVISFVVPGVTHSANLDDMELSTAEREAALQLLQTWGGAMPSLGPPG